MTSTIHYVTEMVEVATGKVTERKTWTIKGCRSAGELLAMVPTNKTYRHGQYVCRVLKSWVA
jgi:hypothetical protein